MRVFEEDEKMARRLQQQEEEVSHPMRDDDSDQISDDEELAHRLQDEEERGKNNAHIIMQWLITLNNSCKKYLITNSDCHTYS